VGRFKLIIDIDSKIHGSKVLLCIWWDMKGIMYYELLNQTVTAERYQQQFNDLFESCFEPETSNSLKKTQSGFIA